MSANTSIQWTDRTWNPVRGCSLVSHGCTNCYAMKQAHRFSGKGGAYEGLTKMTSHGPTWTGKARCLPEMLDAPLHWRKPQRVFVNSMSDLFHEDVPDEFIAEVFGVMAVASHVFWGPGGIGMRVGTRYDAGLTNPRPIRAWGTKFGPHTFQVLTKRPRRMASVIASSSFRKLVANAAYRRAHDRVCAGGLGDDIENGRLWPLPNVHLGVSVEDQATADERVALLLQTSAVVRYISYEPALGRVDLCETFGMWWNQTMQCFEGIGAQFNRNPNNHAQTALDWVIVGGESGPKARPFNLQWARDIIAQCKAAGVPVFVKQLGARCRVVGPELVDDDGEFMRFRDRAGGDMAEWPEDLRIRQFPGEATADPKPRSAYVPRYPANVDVS